MQRRPCLACLRFRPCPWHQSECRWLNMRQIVAAEIRHRQFAEDIIEDRRRHLDGVIALDLPGGSNRVKVKASTTPPAARRIAGRWRPRWRSCSSRAEGGAFLVHVDEDLAEPAVLVLAGPQIDLVAADNGLLGIALAAVGRLGRARAYDSSRRSFSTTRSMRVRRRRVTSTTSSSVFLVLDQLAREGWLSLEPSRYRALAFSASARTACRHPCNPRRGAVRHVDGLGNRARDERLSRRHHADVAFRGQDTACRSDRRDWRSRRPADARPSDAARLPVSSRRSK